MAASNIHLFIPLHHRIMKDRFLFCFISNPRHSCSRLSSSTKARSIYLRPSPEALNQFFNGCFASGANTVSQPISMAPETHQHTMNMMHVSTGRFEFLCTRKAHTSHMQDLFSDVLAMCDQGREGTRLTTSHCEAPFYISA